MAKHAVPKKKASQARSNRRYKDFANEARKRLSNDLKIKTCSHCASPSLDHHVCGACGFYKGKDVMGKSKKAEEKITKIQA